MKIFHRLLWGHKQAWLNVLRMYVKARYIPEFELVSLSLLNIPVHLTSGLNYARINGHKHVHRSSHRMNLII
jgi:hypothetical protein